MALFVGIALWAFLDLTRPADALLGGNSECWWRQFTFASCCDPQVWGPEGNRQCWGSGFDAVYCCRDPHEHRKHCHSNMLNKPLADVSFGYDLGHALEVVACMASQAQHQSRSIVCSSNHRQTQRQSLVSLWRQ
eukprot:2832869-Amphidinium_carterae.2